MKPEAAIEYFNECSNNLKRFLNKSGAKDMEEAIHDLRVEIKKIHFVIYYVHQCNEGLNDKMLYKPYRKIFQRAGRIRDLQMKQELIKKYLRADLISPVIRDLKRQKKKQLKKFKSDTGDNIKKIKGAKRRIILAMETAQTVPALKFADRIVRGLRSQFQNIKKEELHHSRRLLKNIVYAVKMLPHLKIYISKRIDPGICEQLEKSIGSWHDKILFLQWAEDKIQSKTQIKKINTAVHNDYLQIKQEITVLNALQPNKAIKKGVRL